MTQPVRIPADVDREDTVLANLTARQLLILTVAGIMLHGTWTAVRDVVPLAVFALLAIPIAVATVVLALGRRDGISLDRLALAAIRQHMSPAIGSPPPKASTRPRPGWPPATRKTSTPRRTSLRPRWSSPPKASPKPAWSTSAQTESRHWRCAPPSTSPCAPRPSRSP
ncbi:PrgI family protein [Streptomyces malaysiensis]|uniref:PrgI family protein n=1 Tax=Streptomyces malaysiensis TaxID=92644 RepID=UPI00371FA106